MADQFSHDMKPLVPTTKADVVEIARKWLGTPYRHQTSTIGRGTDCLGLLRGIYRELYGKEPDYPHDYRPTWAEERPRGIEPMVEAAKHHLIPLPAGGAVAGDVVLIRVRVKSAVKHCGVLAPNGQIIHAYDRHCVTEEALRPSWAKPRNCYYFAFPGVT